LFYFVTVFVYRADEKCRKTHDQDSSSAARKKKNVREGWCLVEHRCTLAHTHTHTKEEKNRGEVKKQQGCSWKERKKTGMKKVNEEVYGCVFV
jgi:hypothetical protein